MCIMSEAPRLAPVCSEGRTLVLLPQQALADDCLQDTRTQLIALGDGVLDGELHVDMAQIGSLDSSALGMLVALHRRIDDAGGRLVICNLAAHLRELLSLTRLDTMLDVRPAE
jgi:anti-anti-sigma factor